MKAKIKSYWIFILEANDTYIIINSMHKHKYSELEYSTEKMDRL